MKKFKEIGVGSTFDLRTGTWTEAADGMGASSERPSENPNDMLAQITLSSGLSRGERGAVVSDGIAYTGGDLNVHAWPHPQRRHVAMRNALLFNERIDSPRSGNFVYEKITDPDHSEEFFQRTGVYVSSPFRGHTFIEMALDVWREHERAEPGGWTLWSGPNENLLPERVGEEALGFRLQLQDALIVPGKECSLDQVLDFRRQRDREMRALRDHVERLCLVVAESGPTGARVRAEVDAFDAALAAYNASAKRSNLRKVLSSMEIEANWTDVFLEAAKESGKHLEAFAVLALFGWHSGLPLACAAIGTAAVAKIAIKSTFGLQGRKESSPFHYLVLADRELD